MEKLPSRTRRESIDIFDDDDNVNPNKRKKSEEKFQGVYEKNNEKGKSFLEKVGDAIALLHGKTLANLFRHVVNSIFNDNGVRNISEQSGGGASSTLVSLSEEKKGASLSTMNDSLLRENVFQPQSEPPIEAYKDFNSYLEHYRQVVKKNSEEQLVDSGSPNAKLYAEFFLEQVDSEMKSNPQYSPDTDESERVAAAVALLGRKNSLESTKKQYLAFEIWHANRQLSYKKNQRPQTQADLGEAKIYARWFLENKSPTFHPESVEAKKEKSAKYLIDNFEKISASYAKKESASNVNKKQHNQTGSAVKNNELSDSDFYLVPKESDITEKSVSPEKKLSQRDILIAGYKDFLGVDADEDMPNELIQELIDKRKKDDLRESENLIYFENSVHEYNSDEDDGIPMDDDSDGEDDRDAFLADEQAWNSVMKTPSKTSSLNSGRNNTLQSQENIESNMTEWRRDGEIIGDIRSEYEEMFQDQRAFEENKKNAANLADLNRTGNRLQPQASDSLESEFALPTSLFVEKKLGPPPPPPPPRRQVKDGVSTNAPDAASVKLAELVALKNFPNVDHDQLSKALTGADADEDFDGLVIGAGDYFDSLASNSNVDDDEKTKALTLAKIWEGAAQESRRLPGMKALKDYDLLNELLSSQKITKDFKD